jgi:hypothetical protein
LAFIHFQLALPWTERQTFIRARKRFGSFAAGGFASGRVDAYLIDIFEILGLYGNKSVRNAVAALNERAGDYHPLAGPILPISADRHSDGRPLWLWWEVEKSDVGLALPLDGLSQALEHLQLYPAPATVPGANIEYMICRDVGNATMRGRGKLSIPDQLWSRLKPGMDRALVAQALADEIEGFWQARLGVGPGSARGLSVVSREYLLGHWSSTS